MDIENRNNNQSSLEGKRLKQYSTIILFFLILSNSVFSQNQFEDSAKWLCDILKRENKLSYNLMSTINIEHQRNIEIDNGWVLYNESSENKLAPKYEFHLSDLNINTVEVRTRDNIDKNQVLYQIWVNTKNSSDLIREFDTFGDKKRNYFSIYFTNADNADEFAFALKNAIKFSPKKVEKKVQTKKGNMVRNLNWGMSIDEVRLLEKSKLIDDNLGLTYLDTIDGQPFKINYNFRSNELNMMRMDYVLDYEDYNEYLTKYEDLKKELNNQYGNAIKYEEDWKDNSIKGHKNRYGYAISREKLIIRTIYENEFSKIFLVLLGQDGIPTISIAQLRKDNTKAKSKTSTKDSHTSKTIAEFSGRGGKNTRPFSVNTPWEITWDASGSIFQLYLYDMNGNLIGVPANQLNAGKGSSFQVAKGNFYLQVNAIGNWNMQINYAD